MASSNSRTTDKFPVRYIAALILAALCFMIGGIAAGFRLAEVLR